MSSQRYTTFPAERLMLHALLLQAAGEICVEIGAHEGLTTIDLEPDLVIDPWDGTQDSAGDECYQRFLARCPTTVHWRMRSHDATPPKGLGFVFYDGDHRDLSDLKKWRDALVPGGILVAHDYFDPGWPAIKVACDALGLPAHTYRYHPSTADVETYGPGPRGLWWVQK
jgi:hypothetical protein